MAGWGQIAGQKAGKNAVFGPKMGAKVGKILVS
jgi:hypothetical protein